MARLMRCAPEHLRSLSEREHLEFERVFQKAFPPKIYLRWLATQISTRAHSLILLANVPLQMNMFLICTLKSFDLHHQPLHTYLFSLRPLRTSLHLKQRHRQNQLAQVHDQHQLAPVRPARRPGRRRRRTTTNDAKPHEYLTTTTHH